MHRRPRTGATAVTPDELLHIIRSAPAWSGPLSHRAIARTVHDCWPGGTADRYEPGALAWLTAWHPERVGAQLPACSCARGRCALCN